MTGWLITFVILFLLAILPLGVSAKYDAAGVLVRLIAGPAKITLIPGKKKEKKEKPTPKEKKVKKPAAKTATPMEPEKDKAAGGPITDFLPLLQVALDLLNDFRRKLRVDRLEAKIIMAGDDPCDLAVGYGRAWAALGNLWPRLEEFLVIKKRDVQIECNFTADATVISARMDLTITLGRLLALIAVYGWKAVAEFLKIQNKRKGGNVT